MQHMHIMPPHIIITGMPIFIMEFMRSQHSFIISIVMLPIGVILQTISLPDISHVIPIIMGIIGIIIGIMFIPGIIGIIWGIIPPIFIIGIGFIIGFLPSKRLTAIFRPLDALPRIILQCKMIRRARFTPI